MMTRTVFFISDGTGLTAASLGQSLLTQFETITFEKIAIPYVNSPAKAEEAVARINKAFTTQQLRPLVFTTLIDSTLADHIAKSHGVVMNIFQTFINPLETELQIKSSHSIGKTHGLHNDQQYKNRIDAVNFTLHTDDGTNMHSYPKADVILVGVSRCGKTPTSLYMALQFGTYCANYPLTEDDLPLHVIPKPLLNYREKLFGLTIDPKRLHTIRSERRANSHYASLEQCQKEISAAEMLFTHEKIPFISTTTRSIEEIATTILDVKNIPRKVY